MAAGGVQNSNGGERRQELEQKRPREEMGSCSLDKKRATKLRSSMAERRDRQERTLTLIASLCLFLFKK